MKIVRKIKSNELGDLLQKDVDESFIRLKLAYFRLYTMRGFRGVSNPGDFILLHPDYTLLLECKATTKDGFSCAWFQQLEKFEYIKNFKYDALYGILVGFYSNGEWEYVYASVDTVLENKSKRRVIRLDNLESYDVRSSTIDGMWQKMKDKFV